jgi:hypothetical protein
VINKDFDILAEDQKEAKEKAKLKWANGYINRECRLGEFKNFKLANKHLKGIKIEVSSVNFI